jgi:hypothetical protein
VRGYWRTLGRKIGDSYSPLGSVSLPLPSYVTTSLPCQASWQQHAHVDRERARKGQAAANEHRFTFCHVSRPRSAVYIDFPPPCILDIASPLGRTSNIYHSNVLVASHLDGSRSWLVNTLVGARKLWSARTSKRNAVNLTWVDTGEQLLLGGCLSSLVCSQWRLDRHWTFQDWVRLVGDGWRYNIGWLWVGLSEARCLRMLLYWWGGV